MSKRKYNEVEMIGALKQMELGPCRLLPSSPPAFPSFVPEFQWRMSTR